ncbi:uncharacterized protein K452DRAFT_334549 [Aplosporella prunicola CBS 121167]|uniref:Uncharacterized protein n=1 Tax=Aplosporella prunicola CBS 121167 TaxID=1176127 RepID=A0A6A6BA14_9PEZI|nr:uncharacterized protein K452DRAFT_334549 [Aplosporella prunicola CBS 121167]KAF2141039.1 hypothetical protein K452DRAFT_334549 [Aplosporella prunicola CBS 121167]
MSFLKTQCLQLLMSSFTFLFLFCVLVGPGAATYLPEHSHLADQFIGPRQAGNESDYPFLRPACNDIDRPNWDQWHSSWKGDVQKWIATELTNFEKNREGEKGFHQYLVHKYAPNAGDSLAICNGHQVCGIGSCQNLRSNFTSKREKELAYYSLELISNFNNVIVFAKDQGQNAGNRVEAAAKSFLKNFTYGATTAREYSKAKKKHQQIHACFLIITGVFAAYFGALLGFNAGAAAVVPKVIVNSVPAIYAGADGLALQAYEDASQWLEGAETDFGVAWMKLMTAFESSISNTTANWLAGGKDRNGKTIADIAEFAAFFQAPSGQDLQPLSDSITQLWMAAAVNYAWNTERLYIVVTNAPGGCEQDTSGPIQAHECLAEYPNLSFWVYGLDRASEKKKGHANLHTPPSFLTMNGQGMFKFNMTDIVRSSFIRYKKFKNKVHIDGKETLKNYGSSTGNGSSYNEALGIAIGLAGPKTLFDIPVCFNPGGETIAGLSTGKARNYPCMCGDFSWKDGYSEAKDETFDFLVKTGLGTSVDWDHQCIQENHNCKEGKSKIWKGKFPDKMKGDKWNSDINAPFNKCPKRADSKKRKGHLNKKWDMVDQKEWEANFPAKAGKGGATKSMAYADDLDDYMDDGIHDDFEYNINDSFDSSMDDPELLSIDQFS